MHKLVLLTAALVVAALPAAAAAPDTPDATAAAGADPVICIRINEFHFCTPHLAPASGADANPTICVSAEVNGTGTGVCV